MVGIAGAAAGTIGDPIGIAGPCRVRMTAGDGTTGPASPRERMIGWPLSVSPRGGTGVGIGGGGSSR